VPIPGQPLQFFVNTDKAPTDDLRVRQALLYAADREAITQAIFQATSPAAYGPLGAVTLGYDESVVDTYPHDLAKAAALLEEAGWVDSDDDGMRDKDGRPLRLEMILMGWGYVPEVGQMLQSQFRQVGVDVQMQEMAFPAALAAAREGQHNLAPMVFSSSDPGILSSTFHSANADAGFNWAKVRDEELDRLLDAGAQALDEAERLELYAQAQQRIMDLALILPVRDYVNLNGVSIKVKELRYDRSGWFPWLYDVYLTE
jgi:peptide/nickel transport system substrate-binding protein